MRNSRSSTWGCLTLVLLGLWGCSDSDGNVFAQLAGEVSLASAEPAAPEADSRPTNHLAGQTSPYLLLHIHNPVDWYPWGPEAFEKARKEDKPIFLSVGYSSCYWCHVMERRVFSNEEIAKKMNENFVCIKVDREERPDIDDIYMTALQVYFQAVGSSQGGGWPLSLFLTPDGKPIAGGTYYPPDDEDGRIGFPNLLTRVGDIWKNNRETVVSNADILAREVRRVMKPQFNLTPTPLERELVVASGEALKNTFDPKYGGVDFDPEAADRPKFPVPAKLALLQYLVRRDGDEQAAAILDTTLTLMAQGGIRDHLGGGFHRYSVDRQWHVPHFEKMLYDNAQLADVYVEAFRQTSQQHYYDVAVSTFDFILRDMTGPQGGFYSALDAETGSVEGKYYAWSREEVASILSEDEYRIFAEVYGLNEQPSFEHGYVLRTVKSIDEAARGLSIPEPELQRQLAAMRAKLFAVRERLPAPLLDDKILTSWNGLMIRALAKGGLVLGRRDYVAAAEKAALFVLSELRDDRKRLQRSYRAGEARLNAYLDDYAFLVEGLLALHEVTRDDKWLNAARRLTDLQVDLFWDEAAHGFYFTSHDHEELLARTKNAYDAVLPSGNSVSARNLIRLASLSDEQKYRGQAEQTLKVFASNLKQTPRGTTNLALALAEFLDNPDFGAGKVETSSNAVQTPDSIIPDYEQEILPISGESAGDANAKKKKDEEYVTARAYLSVDRLPVGDRCQVVMLVDVREGWHINTNPAQPDFLVATKFELSAQHGAKLLQVQYPKGRELNIQGFDEPLTVYEGRVAIRGIVEIPAAAAGKIEKFELLLRYQACNDAKCLAPRTIKLTGELPVAPVGEAVKKINEKLFAAER